MLQPAEPPSQGDILHALTVNNVSCPSPPLECQLSEGRNLCPALTVSQTMPGTQWICNKYCWMNECVMGEVMDLWTEVGRNNSAWDSVAHVAPAQCPHSRSPMGLPVKTIRDPRQCAPPGGREHECCCAVISQQGRKQMKKNEASCDTVSSHQGMIFAAILRSTLACWSQSRTGMLVLSLCHLPGILFSSVLTYLGQFWIFPQAMRVPCWPWLYFSLHLALSFSRQSGEGLCVVSPHCFGLWSEYLSTFKTMEWCSYIVCWVLWVFLFYFFYFLTLKKIIFWTIFSGIKYIHIIYYGATIFTIHLRNLFIFPNWNSVPI